LRANDLRSQDRQKNEPTLGRLKLLSLGSTADTTREPSEWDDLLVILNVGEVGVRLRQVHPWRNEPNPTGSSFPPTRDRSGHLPHVLEVSPDILAPRLGDYTNVRPDFARSSSLPDVHFSGLAAAMWAEA
jgi:hypothetical protein